MGKVSQLTRALVSLVFSTLVILLFYGYLTKGFKITTKAMNLLGS